MESELAAAPARLRPRRRMVGFWAAAAVLAIVLALVLWWRSHEPLAAPIAEGGGAGRGFFLYSLGIQNAGRFDLRVTGVETEVGDSIGIGEVSALGFGTFPGDVQSEPFHPFTLQPGDYASIVIRYRIFCDRILGPPGVRSGANLDKFGIRYELFGIGRTKRLTGLDVDLAPLGVCEEVDPAA